ncbi:site-specific integrase [Cellulomonas iranensis]|uniref:site-specific integrase n=1 Tax=Cellulomonas iranensis TaxID=76862 RepID=UPI0013D47B62|nr:tyrosine-type recombinase/integrase [Cellulomonas iranensis]
MTVTRVAAGWRARTRVTDSSGAIRDVERVRSSKEAARNAATLAAQAIEPRPGEAPAGQLGPRSTVSALLEAWLDERRPQLRSQSIVTYTRAIEAATRAGITGLTIEGATTPVLDRALKGMAATTPGTARTVRSLLRMALARAVQLGIVERNAADGTAAVRREVQTVRALTDDEARQLLELLREVDQPVPAVQAACALRLQLGTGLRIGEVLALTREDVDLDADVPVVHVRATVVPASDRGLIRQVEPKSSSGRRTVPLTRDAVAALRTADGLGLPGGELGLWFPNLAGSLRQPGSVRSELAHLVRGTELAWVTTHTMRKTAATTVARAYDDATAAALLGHSGVGSLRHYVQRSHQAPDVRDVLERAEG